MRTLAERPDLQLTVNHSALPFVRTTVPPSQPGHLSLNEDAKGLRFVAHLDRADPDAKTHMSKIRSGLLDQCSFSFRVTDQSWNEDHTRLSIKAVSLERGDLSVCNYGASPTTSVIARSAQRAPVRDLRTYQARARAIHIRNEAGRR